MQRLDNLTKGELLELVRTLERRLAGRETDVGSAPQRSPLELEFVCAQALQVLDNSGIPAFIYSIGIDDPSVALPGENTRGVEFQLLAANRNMATLSGYTAEELMGRLGMSAAPSAATAPAAAMPAKK